MSLNPENVKESEQLILESGGQICDWLPQLMRTQLRPRQEIIARALIMNAMMQIYFEAPIEVIDGWLYEHGLDDYVSARESAILSKANDALTHEEKIDLYWYIEGLWALMWVGNLIDGLPFDSSVQVYMASLAPDLQQNEDGSKFEYKMQIRPFAEVFKMLDLYYRLHWYAHDGQINGYETGLIKPDVIKERRRALEWVLQPEVDWDNIELST